ncbi:uncharacterized protein TNCV_465381 [Trichonephila clavipes]|nr:uncharacterized protein TNCV_465381 [Trichonephila clavipes]
MGVNPIFQVTIGFMVLPAGQGQVPHPSIVPECFTINQLWNDRCTWPWGHCLLSELREWTTHDVTTAFKRSRTTSYHPCSNGMIERIHRQLKSSFMCHTDSSWFEALPVVLLGIRNVFKEDLQSSSAELIYGEPLRLQGKFISPLPAEMQSIGPSDFVDRLMTHISRLRPVPVSCHARGPYRILQRIGKVFVLRIGTKEVRVSVDRIKSVYVLTDDPPSSGPSLPTPGYARPTVTTRLGRRVHFN